METGGKKSISIYAINATSDVSQSNGLAYFSIPAELDGATLSRANATVITPGTTNATTITLYKLAVASNELTVYGEMLSVDISIASAKNVGTAGTLHGTAANYTVATDDVVRIDCTGVSTTAPKGLIVNLQFTDE